MRSTSNIATPDESRHDLPLSSDDVFEILEASETTQLDGRATQPGQRPRAIPHLDSTAIYGPLGEWVRMVEPHTEAAPAALLFSALVAVGALIGRGPHTTLDGARHGLNLFALLVGPTSSGRKGTAVAWVRRLLHQLDKDFADRNVASGLSSGQGLIYHVRDPLPSNEGETPADAGVPDKRLLVLESEFAGPLRQMRSDANTLSPVIRDAWDGNRLRTLTRRDAMRASDPHIAILAQITREELRQRLDESELCNGFANRFLFVWTQRARELPFGSEPDARERDAVVDRISYAVNSTRRITALDELTAAAQDWWREHYAELTCDRPGRAGKVTQRAAPQLRRIALLFAALDGARAVDVPHLCAANAVWQYADDSAHYVFDSSDLSRRARRAEAVLLDSGLSGISRTVLAERVFRSKNVTRGQIDTLLLEIERAGIAYRTVESTAGRPRELWTHISFADGEDGSNGD